MHGEGGTPSPTARKRRVIMASSVLVVVLVAAVWGGSAVWREHSARSIERLEDAIEETLFLAVSERVKAEQLLEQAERDAMWVALSEVVSATEIDALVEPELLRFGNEPEWVRHHTGEAQEVVRLLEDAQIELSQAIQVFRDAVE